MLEKLLSHLPYNPNLIHQLRSYGKRMRLDSSYRLAGFIFLALTLIIQIFAVIKPPVSSVASSSNDLVTGGFNSASAAKNDCLNNSRGYQVILHYYGISCDAFNSATTTTIHSTAESNQYFSMGHNPTGSSGETPVTICYSANYCAGTLYWRHLSIWPEPSEGPGGSKGWKALVLHNQNGKLFYALYDCGNIVSIGIPGASPLKPTPAPAPAPTPTPAPTPAPAPAPAPAPTPTPTPTPPAVCAYNSSLPADSSLCFPPCPYNAAIKNTDVECKPCESSTSSQDKISCVQVSKTASNSTQGITDANNTTAQPGDVINYTLFAKNTGKADVEKYTFQENMSDVLDYANIIDLHGGSIDENNIVSWPSVTVKAGETEQEQITVKVKNPVPQTPVSQSDPSHFDLTMTNVYGNTINIKVPGSSTKTIESASTTLPNTGPGTSILIVSVIVVFAGYLLSRSRLIAKECEIAAMESRNLED